MRPYFALLLALPLTASAQTTPWQAEQSGTTADLRGIHAVGGGVAWASGTGGTVLRTEDAGYMWQSCAMPPGAEKLDFRAIWAWDANNAIVMSSGSGALSRLYKTTDGCDHWTLLRTNSDPKGFWDAIAFYDRKNGYLLGDPIDGKLVLERTSDSGQTWVRMTQSDLNVGSRGAFAASNSVLALPSRSMGVVNPPWIGTGGPEGALVLQGSDGADCNTGLAHADLNGCLHSAGFQKKTVPLTGATATQGVFSLAMLQGTSSGFNHPVIEHAIAVGGDYSKPEERSGTAAYWSLGDTSDTWHAATTSPGGYRSAVAWDGDGKRWITVGPNGADVSRDDGRTWQPLEHAPAETPKDGEWNALSLPWVVGPHGRIAKLNPSVAENAVRKTAPVPR